MSRVTASVPTAPTRPVLGRGRTADPRSISGRRPGPHRASIVVLAVGLAVTAVLAITARTLQDSNENRLLHQRVSEAAAVLSAAIPNLQTPLSSGAVLAEAIAPTAARSRA